MPEIVIIGAGLTGLSAAYFCRKEYRLLERERRPGGLCGSVEESGFTFDYSGHFLHLRRPDTRKLLAALAGNVLAEIERSAWIFTRDRYVPFPFQANIHALPERMKKECVSGILGRPRGRRRTHRDFYSWSVATFGKGITKQFMQPYNEKLWTVSARRLGADWVAPFVPRPTLRQMLAGAESEQRGKFGYNATFFYPRSGGSQTVADAFARALPVEYGTTSVAIDYRHRRMTVSSGENIPYETLVSTQPLPELLKQMVGLPPGIKACAERLDWNTVYCCNLAVRGGRDETDGRQWVYFPEKKYPFYRAGVYTNVMGSMAPRGYRTLYVEISARPERNPVSRATMRRLLEGLRDARLVSSGDKVEVAQWLVMPYAYVIYDRHRTAALKTIQGFLKKHGICSVGRYGGWEYSFMEKNILDGQAVAGMLNERG